MSAVRTRQSASSPRCSRRIAVAFLDGFALSADAYRRALDAAGAWPELRRLVSDFDHR